MKFTIITVCYNAQKHIKGTIESVLNQTYTDFQYIIKDGQSLDNTLQIVNQLVKDDRRVVVESNPDTGIYDAMNQALLLAEGEYVFFLNAGDTFHDITVLEQIAIAINRNENADILYGDIVLVGDSNSRIKKYGKPYQHKYVYLLGDCICHQALLTKRELLVEKQYDTTYRICADREWQLYYLEKGAFFLPTHIIISDVLVDGFSMQNVELFEKEALDCIKRYYVWGAWIYKCINVIKRLPFIKRMIKK